MVELTKYQEIKSYLAINGYNSIKELADDWGVHENAIRQNARDTMTSARLSKLISEFIAAGEDKFQRHRQQKLQNAET